MLRAKVNVLVGESGGNTSVTGMDGVDWLDGAVDLSSGSAYECQAFAHVVVIRRTRTKSVRESVTAAVFPARQET